MSKQTGQPRTKLVYHLGTPFTTTPWPEVSDEIQSSILDLLCGYLEPIGSHRRLKSKNKKGSSKNKDGDDTKMTDTAVDSPSPINEEFVDVGLSIVTRKLQVPVSSQVGEIWRGYSLVFIARSGQPTMMHSHLPELVASASSRTPTKPVYLINLSQQCAERLSRALALPRVSAIGIQNEAPGLGAILDFVSKHVSPVQSPWLENKSRPQFVAPNIVAVPTKIGPNKQNKQSHPKTENNTEL